MDRGKIGSQGQSGFVAVAMKMRSPGPPCLPRSDAGGPHPHARDKLCCVMARSSPRFPTAKSIFQLAAKHGVRAHIEYGANGKIASVDIIGKAGSTENGAADVNPWDQVLNNDTDQKRAS
jgi:hypothetical protein